MQIVINIPFQKYILVTVFLTLVIKVGYCIAMMVVGDSMQNLEAALLTARHFIDTTMWAMVAVWFLYIFLYQENLTTRRHLHMTTNFVLVSSMLKFFSTIFFTIHYLETDSWMIFWSVIEMIVWVAVLCYICLLWRSYLIEYNKLHEHDKESKKYFSLKDELERRYKLNN